MLLWWRSLISIPQSQLPRLFCFLHARRMWAMVLIPHAHGAQGLAPCDSTWR